jgi:hypothetical protein
MLNVEILAIACILVLFLVAITAFFTWRRADSAFTWAEAAFKYAQEHSAEEVSRKALASLHAELSDLTESYDQLLQSHKKLRARIGMREVRARRQEENGLDDDIDISTTRDKDALRLALKSKGLLKG